jgi:hypothetical protein
MEGVFHDRLERIERLAAVFFSPFLPGSPK